MPRQSAFLVENNFTKGLITEATGLNFPENACTETYNCVFSESGYVSRRLGIDYETSASTNGLDKTGAAMVEYFWNAAGSTGTANIVVTQIGTKLYFYVVSDSSSLSSGLLASTVNLLTYEVGSSTPVISTPCQFASGQGYLFVVSPLIHPIYVSYNPSGPSVTATQINILTRDLEGDKADANYNNPETRPSSLSNAHKYNLYNQGWYTTIRKSGGGTDNPVTVWDAAFTDFPSNADIWWYFKDSGNNFETNQVWGTAIGNTYAPKGHYILNEFSTNRVSISGITGVTERTSGGKRPSTCAFFTSRIWYAGVTAQDYNQKIYYSQIIESTENFGKCYQSNDPTSESAADLLPSDGGVILIPDVGQVIKLFPMPNGLAVFGTNGVWMISGSEGVGFKATDYSVRKISSVETLSALSFVDVYGAPVWWNADGIFTISPGEISGTENVQSITDQAIKSFFLDIPADSKRYAKGAFNSRTKVLQWVYRSTTASSVDENYTYDRVLNFNMLTKAFYPWTISQPTSGPRVHGLISCRGPLVELVAVRVVDGSGNPVVDSSGQQVIAYSSNVLSNTLSFRYLTTKLASGSTSNFTWSQEYDDAYQDWVTPSNTTDYESYFFSGYRVHGDATKFFENNYLTIYATTSETASAFVQGVWDYANSPGSARFTTPQQVYTNTLMTDVQQTRKKIRGRGRSLQFKFYSETGKPFQLHGWSAWETRNAGV